MDSGAVGAIVWLVAILVVAAHSGGNAAAVAESARAGRARSMTC